MIEITLSEAGKALEEAAIQNWFIEEGDLVHEGDDLVELSTDAGTITVQAPASGVLVEVYYDEGESVTKEDILCIIDPDAQ